eukprot:1365097-Amphidinium_carterae.1
MCLNTEGIDLDQRQSGLHSRKSCEANVCPTLQIEQTRRANPLRAVNSHFLGAASRSHHRNEVYAQLRATVKMLVRIPVRVLWLRRSHFSSVKGNLGKVSKDSDRFLVIWSRFLRSFG